MDTIGITNTNELSAEAIEASRVASLPGWSRARRVKEKRDDVQPIAVEAREIHGQVVPVKIYKRGRGNLSLRNHGQLRVELSLAALRSAQDDLLTGRYYERFHYDYDDPIRQLSEVGTDKFN